MTPSRPLTKPSEPRPSRIGRAFTISPAIGLAKAAEMRDSASQCAFGDRRPPRKQHDPHGIEPDSGQHFLGVRVAHLPKGGLQAATTAAQVPGDHRDREGFGIMRAHQGNSLCDASLACGLNPVVRIRHGDGKVCGDFTGLRSICADGMASFVRRQHQSHALTNTIQLRKSMRRNRPRPDILGTLGFTQDSHRQGQHIRHERPPTAGWFNHGPATVGGKGQNSARLRPRHFFADGAGYAPGPWEQKGQAVGLLQCDFVPGRPDPAQHQVTVRRPMNGHAATRIEQAKTVGSMEQLRDIAHACAPVRAIKEILHPHRPPVCLEARVNQPSENRNPFLRPVRVTTL